MATSTVTTTESIELVTQPSSSYVSNPKTQARSFHDSEGIVLGRGETSPIDDEPPADAVGQSELWHKPRKNLHRTLACFWALLGMGMNDAAYGALIPYLETYYGLSYIVVSLIFLAPFVGYTLAALTNATIHNHFGQRGIAATAPTSRLVAYLVISFHPPYPVLVVMYLINGFGIGLADAAWNAYIGDMQHANQVLGFLHGFYGLGATLSPLIAASMVRSGLQWYAFYWLMVGVVSVELATSLYSFWAVSGAVFRRSTESGNEALDGAGSNSSSSRLKQALFKKPSARVTWLCAVFLLGYVGVEVAIGGWIVTFMIRVRHKGKYPSSISATGFWLGLTIGRVLLGFVTARLGEKIAISAYLVLAMVLELLFWLIPQFYVSAIAVAFLGFFMGPLFPAAVVVATKLLPKRLHVTSIGFAAAFGGCGAAVFPFAVGAIAQKKGVQVLPPIVLALLAAILGLWLALPKVQKKRD